MTESNESYVETIKAAEQLQQKIEKEAAEAASEMNAAIKQRELEIQTLIAQDQHHAELTEVLGSPTLARACLEPRKHGYVLKLKSGEELMFSELTWHENGWLTLEDLFSHAHNPESFISGQVRSCLDVRLEDISWVMRNPSGF